MSCGLVGTSTSSPSEPPQAPHELVEALIVNGENIAKFVYNKDLGWYELNMTHMAKLCKRRPENTIQNEMWKTNLRLLSEELGIEEDKLFRKVKGQYATNESDAEKSVSLQGTFCHQDLATTFASLCNPEYGYRVQRFVTRLHQGKVTADELKKVSDDTMSGLTASMGRMSFDREQVRVDSIELNKMRNRVVEAKSPPGHGVRNKQKLSNTVNSVITPFPDTIKTTAEYKRVFSLDKNLPLCEHFGPFRLMLRCYFENEQRLMLEDNVPINEVNDRTRALFAPLTQTRTLQGTPLLDSSMAKTLKKDIEKKRKTKELEPNPDVVGSYKSIERP